MVPVLRFELATLRILAASAALSDAVGHAPDALQAMTLADLLASEDLAEVMAALDGQVVATCGVRQLSCRSGAYWPAEMRCRREMHKGAESVLVVLQDATHRVALEREREELADRQHEREAHLLSAQKLLDIGVWKMDLDADTLVWSQNVHGIYGVDTDRSAADLDDYIRLVHPDDRAEMTKRVVAFRSSGAEDFSFHHRVLRPDGKTIHVRGAAKVQKAGARRWLTGVVQDITDEVHARERLSEASRMQRIAGRAARLGGWRVDLDPLRMTWSPETAAIHEAPEGTMLSAEDGINYYAPEYREKISSVFNACVKEGRSFDEVAQIVTARGNRVWVRTIGEASRDAAGTIVGVEGAFQDISELVAARDSSEGLSRRLRQTLESMSDAFMLLDSDWRYLFLNTNAEALIGRSRDDLLGKNMWEEFPEAIGNAFHIQYQRAVTDGCSVQFQEFSRTLGKWLEVDVEPTPEGIAVYFRDITQQRARDEQLRLLEAGVSRQTDILLITEADPIDVPDGPKMVYVNDAFVKRTGYSRDEAIGATPRILQGPKTQRDELNRIRRALEKWRPVRAELINYTKFGEEFWLEIDIVPIADENGRYTHFVSVERDITERKKAEEVNRLNQERFRMVTQATNDIIWDWDVIADNQWWNENLQKIFGHDPAQIEPGLDSWKNRLHPEDRDAALAGVDMLIAGSDDFWSGEYRFRHADGHYLTVFDRSFVIRDAEGKALRMMGSMIDVSSQREMENRLRQSQKLEAMGQLTGGVAHDFNNLLTVILGNAELLADQLGDQVQARALAELTATAAERGAELTNRLLAFSRKQALEPRVLDVSRVIRGMDGMLRRTLSGNIDIEVIRAGGLWKTEVDPGQLEAAILNLALNARDAMPEGGCLTIEMANAALDDDYAADQKDIEAGQYVVIVVSDTGHGIAPDTLPRIFEPFFTTKEIGKGSGLGLSMVYGFVKQSGGHIRAYSELGEGTSFKLYFRRSRAEETPARSAVSSKESVGGAETILVVEDDPMVREHLIAQLKRLGYNVLEAPAGKLALDLLRQTPEIDLLFTDVVMPGGMGGRELADTARVLRPDLKVLFTSGYTENAIVHHGRLDPGVDLISKPYRREQLATKVRKVLDRQ